MNIGTGILKTNSVAIIHQYITFLQQLSSGQSHQCSTVSWVVDECIQWSQERLVMRVGMHDYNVAIVSELWHYKDTCMESIT